LAWWLWVIVGVGSAVYLITVLAAWAAFRLSARFEDLAHDDLVEQYVSPTPSARSGRPRNAAARLRQRHLRRVA